MYRPEIKRKRSGAPVLSRKEIDVIGQNIVGDFMPEALKSPQEIDIDLFFAFLLFRIFTFYIIRFGTRGGIQVRSNRLFASYEDADSSIHKKIEKRTGYRSPYDYIH